MGTYAIINTVDGKLYNQSINQNLNKISVWLCDVNGLDHQALTDRFLEETGEEKTIERFDFINFIINKLNTFKFKADKKQLKIVEIAIQDIA